MTAPAAGPPAASAESFGSVQRRAFVPTAVVGAASVPLVAAFRGMDGLLGGALGLIVGLLFFGSGVVFMTRVVPKVDPHATTAASLTVYLFRALLLFGFVLAFKGASWLDGPALGIVVFVVAIAWQIFAIRALRRARLSVYDEVGP